MILLLHSVGVLGSEAEQPSSNETWFSRGVHWWIDVDTKAIAGLQSVDPLWVAKQYVDSVRPTPPPRLCLGPQYLCIAQEIADRTEADKQAANPMYWIAHIPQLLWGVPATTLVILATLLQQGQVPGIVAVICVLLAGWLCVAAFLEDDWFRIILAPFAGSALAGLAVFVVALPLLRLSLGVLQLTLHLALTGLGLFTILDRGHLLMGIWEGPLKRWIEPLVKHETKSAGLQEEAVL